MIGLLLKQNSLNEVFENSDGYKRDFATKRYLMNTMYKNITKLV